MREEKIKLTVRDLERVLDWANILSRLPQIKWTKHDAELYYKINEDIKTLNRIRNQNNRLK